MSTYNGVRFLTEQIDSILSQTGVDVRLLVRDDGSSDSTLEMLLDYEFRHPDNIKVVAGTNIGWKKSFLSLLDLADEHWPGGKWFAFSDQDDIWLPDKLSTGVAMLRRLPEEIKLYCSNLSIYKEGKNLGILTPRHHMAPTPQNCLVRNLAGGCTMIFPRSLRDVIAGNKPSAVFPHDFWIYQTAVLLGRCIIDAESHILYRQHESNQIGSKTGIADIWNRRLRSLRDLSKGDRREMMARQQLECFSHLMKPAVRESVEKMANYRKNLFSRIRLMADNRYTSGIRANDFWLKLRILAGRL